MYSFKDAAKTRSAAPSSNKFAVTAFTVNKNCMTALRGRGEYKGGSFAAANSLLNDYFLSMTTKVADW